MFRFVARKRAGKDEVEHGRGRPGVHVAMNAGQVAELTDIDLQDLRLRVAERERVLSELARKRVVGRQVHR